MSLAGVVLAAGAGTRLRPLTTLRPKALCPVGGRPLVDLAVERLEPWTGAGPQRVAVNAHHHADQLLAHLDGRVHVSVEQPQALGTAGALGALHDWLDGRDVLLTNADAYLPGGLDDLVGGWDGGGTRLLVVPAPPGSPPDFTDSRGPWRYVGACLLPWAAVRDLPAQPCGLYEVLWRDLAERGALQLAPTGQEAVDCGTPADYLRANLLASGGRSVVGPGAVVEGRLTRCVVWDGAVVGPQEDLVDVVRAGTRAHPLTVHAADP